jgi:hypothetical protein
MFYKNSLPINLKYMKYLIAKKRKLHVRCIFVMAALLEWLFKFRQNICTSLNQEGQSQHHLALIAV